MDLLGGIGNLVGSALSYFGTKSTNEDQIGLANANNIFNAQQAQLSETFNADQANLNRQFQAGQTSQQEQFQQQQVQQLEDYQTQMSNSAYSRAVAGMEAAGLNPMLAYAQGPASTPQGGMGQGASASGSVASRPMASAAAVPNITNPMSAAVNTAYAGARVIGDLRQAMAAADKSEAEAANARVINPVLVPEIEQRIRTGASSAGQLDALKSRIETLIPADLRKTYADAIAAENQSDLTFTERNALQRRMAAGGPEVDVAAERANIGLRNAQAVLSTQSAQNLGLQVPGLERQAEMYRGPWGGVSPYVNEAAKLTSTAKGLMSLAP